MKKHLSIFFILFLFLVSSSGYCNNISRSNFIGAGQCNCIDTTGDAGSCFGVIGGGLANMICAGTCFASILGGYANTNSGCYSAILGGVDNVIPSGCQYAGIFGNSITAQINNGLHLNNLWLNPTAYCSFNGCAPSGHFCLGTIYIDTSISACGALRVQQ